jgi:hypothetical protein
MPQDAHDEDVAELLSSLDSGNRTRALKQHRQVIDTSKGQMQVIDSKVDLAKMLTVS